MEKFIKNLDAAKVLSLVDQVNYLDGQIVSKTLAQNEAVSLTLFAFDQGEAISTHDSDGDALILVLDGKGQITIDGKDSILSVGQSILMPAKIPHAVYAIERFKMFLIVVFQKKGEKNESKS
jgi:quercetin dioxygenase-like cupin family protein